MAGYRTASRVTIINNPVLGNYRKLGMNGLLFIRCHGQAEGHFRGPGRLREFADSVNKVRDNHLYIC